MFGKKAANVRLPRVQASDASAADMPTNPKPNEDSLWRQYELVIDLYKHYLELAVKFNAFYYVATGAILSFYFSRTDIGLVRFSLLFPLLMSVGFGILFFYGAVLLRTMRQDIFDLRDKLNLDVAPDLNVLAALLIISACLMLIVAIVLAWLFFARPT